VSGLKLEVTVGSTTRRRPADRRALSTMVGLGPPLESGDVRRSAVSAISCRHAGPSRWWQHRHDAGDHLDVRRLSRTVSNGWRTRSRFLSGGLVWAQRHAARSHAEPTHRVRTGRTRCHVVTAGLAGVRLWR
jgi:hypothetical protein